VSSQAINLRGASFTEGIEFRFPETRDTPLAPGQRLLLVSDLFQFQRRHGIDIPVAGIFNGRLNNAGEPVTLVNTTGEAVFHFTYKGGFPWPTEADGGGYSLVLARPELGLNNPAAWRISSLPEGNPGADDRLRFTGAPETDVDQDGVAALLEYALGTRDDDPASGAGAALGDLGVDPQANLSFARQAGADDIDVWVEFSPDLIEWKVANRMTARPTGTGMIEETWGASSLGEPSIFLRLRVALR